MLKVLVVDDEPDVRAAIVMVCQGGGGLEVVGEAESGQEAIELAEKLEPDVIVLDFMMPGMNGELAAGVIRAVSPASRIVACSAVIDAKPEWADAFIDKVHISDLPALLTNLERA